MKKRIELRGWSYSAWSSLQQCPYRFEQGYLLGVKGPKSWFLEKGIAQHKVAEEFLKGNIGKLPKSFGMFRKFYDRLKRSKNLVVEQFWGADKKFRPFEPDFKKGERSWCVMKMDAAVTPTKQEPRLFIQDLKGGRIYDSHAKQGGLYAVIGSQRFENDGVDVEFWYPDQDDIRTYHYTPERLKDLTKLWIERGNDVMSPRKKYRATPSEEACKYCFLRSDKGGPCNAWRNI